MLLFIVIPFNSNPLAFDIPSVFSTIDASFTCSGNSICTVGLLNSLSVSLLVCSVTVKSTLFSSPTGKVSLSFPKFIPNSAFDFGLTSEICFDIVSVEYIKSSSPAFCIPAIALIVNESILSIFDTYSSTLEMFKIFLLAMLNFPAFTGLLICTPIWLAFSE